MGMGHRGEGLEYSTQLQVRFNSSIIIVPSPSMLLANGEVKPETSAKVTLSLDVQF